MEKLYVIFIYILICISASLSVYNTSIITIDNLKKGAVLRSFIDDIGVTKYYLTKCDKITIEYKENDDSVIFLEDEATGFKSLVLESLDKECKVRGYKEDQEVRHIKFDDFFKIECRFKSDDKSIIKIRSKNQMSQSRLRIDNKSERCSVRYLNVQEKVDFSELDRIYIEYECNLDTELIFRQEDNKSFVSLKRHSSDCIIWGSSYNLVTSLLRSKMRNDVLVEYDTKELNKVYFNFSELGERN